MAGASKLLMLRRSPFHRLSRRFCVYRIPRLNASFSSSSSFISLPRSALRSPWIRFSPRDQFHTQVAPWDAAGDPLSRPASFEPPHPWPEWSNLGEQLSSRGFSDRKVPAAARGEVDDSFSEELPEDFLKIAKACLSFAHDRPELLRLLSRKDVEIVVENGSPFLFENSMKSASRMRGFLSGSNDNGLQSETAQTVDIMRYLVSYARCISASSFEKFNNRVAVEASARKLLDELLTVSGFVGRSTYIESEPTSQSMPEMKPGDWICPACSFMNFARNVTCRQCQEARPMRHGGEWECPQCDFFNYGRNTSCLKCDCKRPCEVPGSSADPSSSSVFGRSSSIEQILGGSSEKSDMERKLAENEEKAERWFRKVSQMDNSTFMSSAANDEDFPEIMPLRKGVNRFVVSNRKTPLERRLANTQFGKANTGLDEAARASISESLERILSITPRANHVQAAPKAATSATESTFSPSEYRRRPIANQSRGPDYVPFVPERASQPESPISATHNSNISSVELPAQKLDASSEGGLISNENNPDIMPIRHGESRFAVIKKRERSSTSAQYKRRYAMEQADDDLDLVPFVPFPPDYFAKKDKVPETSPTPSGTAPLPSDHALGGSYGSPSAKPADSWNAGASRNGYVVGQNPPAGQASWSSRYSSPAPPPSDHALGGSYGSPGAKPADSWNAGASRNGYLVGQNPPVGQASWSSGYSSPAPLPLDHALGGSYGSPGAKPADSWNDGASRNGYVVGQNPTAGKASWSSGYTNPIPLPSDDAPDGSPGAKPTDSWNAGASRNGYVAGQNPPAGQASWSSGYSSPAPLPSDHDLGGSYGSPGPKPADSWNAGASQNGYVVGQNPPAGQASWSSGYSSPAPLPSDHASGGTYGFPGAKPADSWNAGASRNGYVVGQNPPTGQASWSSGYSSPAPPSSGHALGGPYGSPSAKPADSWNAGASRNGDSMGQNPTAGKASWSSGYSSPKPLPSDHALGGTHGSPGVKPADSWNAGASRNGDSMGQNPTAGKASWSSGYSSPKPLPSDQALGGTHGSPGAKPADNWNAGASRNGDSVGQNLQPDKANWGGGYSFKSLEGSAVKEEPDPLDMSEEAKTERWFRRVAQIKDISELSQIPDEDFPSIMPMRKGVNRFVVSKRKTPLERRLTSPQYRRNLPITASEPREDGS